MDVPSSSREPLTITITDENRLPSRDDVVNQLRNGIKQLHLPLRHTSDPNSLKIKLEHCNEKRCISIVRPVQMTQLEASVRKLYGKPMNIYYVQGKSEVVIVIRTQDDLDRAVEVVDRGNLTSLRLLLSKHETVGEPNWAIQPDQSGTYTGNVIEVPYSESCSSCGVARMSLARSAGGASTGSSGVIIDSDDWRFSAPSPRAPVNWRKGKKIGNGAFGSVFVAHDVDTGRDVALKRVPLIAQNREASREAQGLEYDVRELARLQHPRILQYLGVQKTPDSVLIFMEYMPGGSVKDLIAIEGHLSSGVCRRYIGQVLEGLAFLHKNHIVHRDIKPANILRDLDGNVKIADFGSGKKLQSLATQQGGGFNGTIHYTAPEVLLGKSAYGRKADVWSVGVSLMEMISGKVPWHELEPMAAMYQIAYEDPVLEFADNIDMRVVDLVKALMVKDFNLRPMANEVLVNHPAFQ